MTKSKLLYYYGDIRGVPCTVQLGFRIVNAKMSHREGNHLVITIDKLTLKVDPNKVRSIDNGHN